MSQRQPIKTYVNQIIRRLQRWYEIDPEFKSYLPESHMEYRYPTPGSQPDAMVPHQAFIKEFKIRYYDRDYRAEYAEGRKPNIVYRQLVLANPMRLQPGQTLGPFYGYGMENKRTISFHEANNKQVYSYSKEKYIFRPADAERKEDIRAIKEGGLLYQEMLASSSKQQQQQIPK